MNLAIDSLPLAKDFFSCADYSGLQLYGLEHRPLHRASTSVEESEDGRRWTVRLGEHTWTDGSKVTPEDYLQGFEKFLGSQTRILRFLKPRVKSITYTADQLVVEFMAPFSAGGSLFRLSGWAPYKGDAHSGLGRLVQVGAGEWRLHRRDGTQDRVRLVSSPAENERLFRDGALDFSADTAISLDMVDENVLRRDTGLFGTLVFGRFFSDDAAINLSRALNDLEFSAPVQNAYPNLRRKATDLHSEPSSLTIAYDPFYPNLDICTEIAVHLRCKGWRVSLLEDDYYSPSVTADIKFMILRKPVAGGPFFSLMLGGLPKAHSCQAELASLVERAAQGWVDEFEAMRMLKLGLPLFKIPSLYRAKGSQKNPILEVFS